LIIVIRLNRINEIKYFIIFDTDRREREKMRETKKKLTKILII